MKLFNLITLYLLLLLTGKLCLNHHNSELISKIVKVWICSSNTWVKRYDWIYIWDDLYTFWKCNTLKVMLIWSLCWKFCYYECHTQVWRRGSQNRYKKELWTIVQDIYLTTFNIWINKIKHENQHRFNVHCTPCPLYYSSLKPWHYRTDESLSKTRPPWPPCWLAHVSP